MIETPAPPPWVVCPKPNGTARLRLFCFPYAGAGPSIFRAWSDDLPREVEICAIQLPGREGRFKEPPFRRLAPLVQALATGIAPWLTIPFAFFGHSMGALVSFELTRELRRRGATTPVHLFLSGRRAPQVPEPDPLHMLPEPELLAKLRAMGGIPEVVLREPELVALFLPILRADLTVIEAVDVALEEPLECPISTFGGTQDGRASRADLEAWRQHTRRDFTLEMLPGGHFFLQSARLSLLRSMSRTLSEIVAGLPPALSAAG